MVENGTIVERKAFSTAKELSELDYPHLSTLLIEEIDYMSDGLRVKGYLIRPKEGREHPCIIYNRGGNREFGAITPERVVKYLSLIASWGYIVAASQYRGNMGGEGREEFGGEDVNDVLNLIPLLENIAEADTERIGVIGGSRGGLMTYKALTMTDRFRAAAVRCGVVDLLGLGTDRSEMEEVYQDLIPGYDPRDGTTLISRSPIYWAEKMCKTTPILILHGTADWRVNPLSSVKMAEKLLALQHPFRLLLLEGSDHALSEHRSERNREIKEWMDRFVRDKGELPELEPHGD